MTSGKDMKAVNLFDELVETTFEPNDTAEFRTVEGDAAEGGGVTTSVQLSKSRFAAGSECLKRLSRMVRVPRSNQVDQIDHEQEENA